MRIKIVRYSFVLLIVGVSCFLLLNHKTPTLHTQTVTVAENEEIIASAIIDSINDVTRVPIQQAGIVKKINVTVGQMVKKGQALLALDDTSAKHGITINRIALKQAENNVIIQEKILNHSKAELKRLKNMDKRAISQADLRDKTHEVEMAAIKLEQMKHDLDASRANLKNVELIHSQFTILAPKDGVVLQINAHLDEFVGGGYQIVFLSDAQKIIVRVSIDERDAINFNPNAPAYLTSTENEKLKIPVKFIQLDRYIITQERLNSRVQEALYFFDRKDYPNLAAGQQFDAHILIKTT